MSNRIAKVVRRKDTSVANAYRYPRWIYRVVVCTPSQRGYLNERGVELVHDSDFVTYAGGPKDRRERAECDRIAAECNANLVAGLDWNAPVEVCSDYLAEKV